MVTGTKRKEVKRKKKTKIHQDRNQVLKIQVGVTGRSMVIDIGPFPKGWEGKVVYLAQRNKRDLKKGTIGLALVTQ